MYSSRKGLNDLPKLTVERRGNGHRQKHPMPKWSHQRELEGMIGKEITLIFDEHGYQTVGELSVSVNETITGMLVNADAFAIQLAFINKSVVTYYKHSIRGYAPTHIA